jgi:hypothetical protein
MCRIGAPIHAKMMIAEGELRVALLVDGRKYTVGLISFKATAPF